MHTSEDRPTIPSITNNIGTQNIEQFQNNSLRPIIKQLHDQIIFQCSLNLKKYKGKYFNLSEEQKAPYLKSLFKSDQKYKTELKGMIMGHFTTTEFSFYAGQPHEIDKRIFSIIEERILTNQSELLNLLLEA